MLTSSKSSGPTYDPRALGLKVAGSAGEEYIVACPFHGDTNPSACFNPRNGAFFCFSCGAAAGVHRLALACGGTVVRGFFPPPTRRVSSVDWRPVLNSPLALDHAYLAGRQVSDKAVRRHGIRALPGAIAVPVTDADGAEVGVIIRREEGTPRYLYFGDKPPLWPLGELMRREPGTRLYVVEGVFGKLRAERAGLPAVAVMGASVQSTLSLYLRAFDVVVAFDADFAGYAGAGRVLSLVPSARVVVPGVEADELSVREWRDLHEGLSGDPVRFRRQLPWSRKS
jgi:hypothetical protein